MSNDLQFAIIEDERLARVRLKRMVLELRPEAICLGEAANGVDGLELLKQIQPDLLFLDIEFPPEGAFGFLKQAKLLELNLPPIAFVTAYNEYAIEAFRWAACDYLLKPVEKERLEETLSRVQPARVQDSVPDISALLQALQSQQEKRMPERLTLTYKDRVKVLAWSDVTHLTTENRLLFVHTSEGRFVYNRSIEDLEKLLAPRFYRCHRSVLIALDQIRELLPDPSGAGELILHNGAKLPVSRERMQGLRKRLS